MMVESAEQKPIHNIHFTEYQIPVTLVLVKSMYLFIYVFVFIYVSPLMTIETLKFGTHSPQEHV